MFAGRFKNIMVLIWLLPVMAVAQPLSVKVKASRDTILIGEPVQVLITVSGSEAALNDFKWFDIPDKMEHFEVTDKTGVQLKQENGLSVKSQQITITSFDSGRWQLPAFISDKYKTDSVPVVVNTVAVSPLDDYRPVKEIIPVSKPINYLLIAIIAGCVLLAVLLAWFIIRYLKGRVPKEKTAAAPALPPFEEAMRALDALAAKQLPAQGKFKTCCTEADRILKQYITRQSGITSLVNTNKEMKTIIGKYRLPAHVTEPVNDWFTLSDAAKFAQYQPAVADADAGLETIRSFIQHLNGAATA
jgi:hypothetical protein